MSDLILPLFGDNVHNDACVIRHLLNNGQAVDMRTNMMISAPSLREMPTGLYLLTPKLQLQQPDSTSN